MVPDIEWGKNIRMVLDVGCTESSFVAALLEKEVLTLSLGLKDDLVDLAQVALERGFPAVVSPFGTRRLPFPSGVFDAIHCGGCGIPWHSNGGKLLLEINRILRPGGYFMLSKKYDNFEEEEALSLFTASICWNILVHNTDEISELRVKIHQKPESNDIYELRRNRNPPTCKEEENADAAWYVPMKTCLHTIPASIEQRGAEWPDEWPKRLEIFPDWLSDREKVIAETDFWKAIVNKSYLNGIGIDWSSIRNVMDMNSIYGGFAAALSPQKVWVMNVVPVNEPDKLAIIYERGLLGIFHDWSESFGTYPRSYDLLHADHLFSLLKDRSKQPVGVAVEMDRILRPGGWAIIRDKVIKEGEALTLCCSHTFLSYKSWFHLSGNMDSTVSPAAIFHMVLSVWSVQWKSACFILRGQTRFIKVISDLMVGALSFFCTDELIRGSDFLDEEWGAHEMEDMFCNMFCVYMSSEEAEQQGK
ncbi:hypothetical protein NE237_023830 [Protea cynaroides]|uniref:Methyltransferase n=1 Tax=Protea cynaroides TaxID=273540 RepID=A0A9Q0HC68_9MAGN|nr:hypothetical protein NE237_023830 [Protea cynaroides]